MLDRRGAQRAAYEAMTLVAQRPSLALPIARLRGHGVVVDGSTDVVIEGYPRSANSFTVAAFARAQPSPVRIAHHTHAPAQVIEAVRRGLPTIVLVREPRDAVVEFCLVKRALSVGQALRGYVRFYRPLLALREGFVVGTFEEVTTDLGAVMRRVNERFGTSFVPFVHTEENVRACFADMEGYWMGRVGPGLPLLGRNPAGTETAGDEAAAGAVLRAQFDSLAEPARRQAAAIHLDLTGGAGG